MRALWVTCLLVGCASGRGSFEQPDAAENNGSPDARVVRDAPLAQPDAAVVVVTPDAQQQQTPDAGTPQPVCHDQQLLANPVLDLNPSGMGWVQQNIDSYAPIITGDDGIVEHTAPFKAWMGGLEAYDYGVNSVTDVLYQNVAVPANTTQLRFTGQYDVRTAETATVAYDTAQVALTRTDGTPLLVIKDLSNLTTTTQWTALDMTSTTGYAGQTIRVRITTTNDVIDPTSFYFDTLALTATICQ
jgi:hypothetical protein